MKIMSDKENKVKASIQESPKPAPPLNEETMKGVWVDGVGFYIGKEYVLLDGMIHRPRSEKPLTVCRMIFPTSALEGFIKGLNRGLEQARKALKPKEKKRK